MLDAASAEPGFIITQKGLYSPAPGSVGTRFRKSIAHFCKWVEDSGLATERAGDGD